MYVLLTIIKKSEQVYHVSSSLANAEQNLIGSSACFCNSCEQR